MARPRWHLVATLPVAWWGVRRGGVGAALAALCGGVLIDADHLLDYGVTRLTGRRSWFLAPLHGWEWAGGLALAVWPRRRRPLGVLLAALAVAWALHLVHDLLSNRPAHPGVYALSFRLWHRFRSEATGWSTAGGFHAWTDGPWWRWV